MYQIESIVTIHYRSQFVQMVQMPCFLAIAVFACMSARVDASCGDYLSHEAMRHAPNQFGQLPQPQNPYSNRCNGGGCRELPPAFPGRSNEFRVDFRPILDAKVYVHSFNEFDLFAPVHRDRICPASERRQVLLRPPIL